MNQIRWLLTAEISALWQESTPSPAVSADGWPAVAALALLLVLAAVGVSAWRWRRNDASSTPLPPPGWLSKEALTTILQTPVGPKTQDEAHAYRLARLLIGELNEFCEAQVELGVRHKDLYARLQEDLDRSREAYLEMTPGVAKDFLQQEVLHCVAKGDPTAFG